MDPHPPTRYLERLEVDRFQPITTTIRDVGEGFVVLDVAGAERVALDVPHLIAQFARVRGEELTATWFGWMNGAIESGSRAAREVNGA